MTSRVLTLGSDPEVAVATHRGRVVPVCGLIGGDKGAPIPVNEYGGWLEDGVALELNPVPAKTAVDAQIAVHQLLKSADKTLADKGSFKTVYPIIEVNFDDAALAAHPKASAFGCAPDFHAYRAVGDMARTGVMDKAMDDFGTGIRFYGGHIHFGVTDWPSALPKFIAVRLMDFFLGYPYLMAYVSSGSYRDRYYGMPGLFRETPYGVEYRTLTNHWVGETSQKPITMSRAFFIGKMIAEFEKYSADLVSIYNRIDWPAFSEAIMLRDVGTLHGFFMEAAGPNFVESKYDGVGHIKVGDLYFPRALKQEVRTEETIHRDGEGNLSNAIFDAQLAMNQYRANMEGEAAEVLARVIDGQNVVEQEDEEERVPHYDDMDEEQQLIIRQRIRQYRANLDRAAMEARTWVRDNYGRVPDLQVLPRDQIQAMWDAEVDRVNRRLRLAGEDCLKYCRMPGNMFIVRIHDPDYLHTFNVAVDYEWSDVPNG